MIKHISNWWYNFTKDVYDLPKGKDISEPVTRIADQIKKGEWKILVADKTTCDGVHEVVFKRGSMSINVALHQPLCLFEDFPYGFSTRFVSFSDTSTGLYTDVPITYDEKVYIFGCCYNLIQKKMETLKIHEDWARKANHVRLKEKL